MSAVRFPAPSMQTNYQIAFGDPATNSVLSEPCSQLLSER
jgi:hypothetical protein